MQVPPLLRKAFSETYLGVRVLLLAGILVAGAGQVDITLDRGHVSITALHSTAAEVLRAWARAGQFELVEAENIVDAPLTLSLSSISEEDALAVVLRSSAGYIARRRPQSSLTEHQSLFDRVVILPAAAPGGARQMSPVAEPSPPVSPSPPPADVVDPRRIIGADGRPVDDDQQDAPAPAPPR
jgi:hypothetical protein